MSWTKRQFVNQAFIEIGFANYAFDIEPEQLQTVLTRLDSMMATWNVKGIRVGYPLPSSQGSSDLDQETNVPDYVNEGIYTNLAVRTAPMFGKVLSQDTKQAAKDAYIGLLQQAIGAPLEMRLPGTMPAGAGKKPWRIIDNPFLNRPVEPLLSGQDGEIEFD